jgi:hypothetical protein
MFHPDAVGEKPKLPKAGVEVGYLGGGNGHDIQKSRATLLLVALRFNLIYFN